MWGAETNILDFEGNTDLGESYAGQLDWVVASIHRLGLPGLENPDVEKCTHLWSQIAKNPRVNIIAHSRRPPSTPTITEKVIPLFGENHKLVEINNHSFDARKAEHRKLQENRPLLQKARGCPLWSARTPTLRPMWGTSATPWRCFRRLTSPKS